NRHKESKTFTHWKTKEKLETSTCRRKQRCPMCFETVTTRHVKKHKCGYFYCPRCQQQARRDQNHKCYMKPLEKKEKEKFLEDFVKDYGALAFLGDVEFEQGGEEEKQEKEDKCKGWIAFDFETTQDTQFGENQEGLICMHKVVYCVAQKVCKECKNKPLGIC